MLTLPFFSLNFIMKFLLRETPHLLPLKRGMGAKKMKQIASGTEAKSMFIRRYYDFETASRGPHGRFEEANI